MYSTFVFTEKIFAVSLCENVSHVCDSGKTIHMQDLFGTKMPSIRSPPFFCDEKMEN